MLIASAILAQVAPDATVDASQIVAAVETLKQFYHDNPSVGLLFWAMALARIVFKPLFTWLHNYVASTPTTDDDAFLAKVEQSKWFKVLSFIVDLLTSIKLKK